MEIIDKQVVRVLLVDYIIRGSVYTERKIKVGNLKNFIPWRMSSRRIDQKSEWCNVILAQEEWNSFRKVKE